MLTILTPMIFPDVFADTFDVYFDKQLYGVGDLLTISGEITDFGMPVIAMKIYDPDGKILSANNLQIISEKTFTKTLSLDSPFYNKTGQYVVTLDYGHLSENYYFIVDGENIESVPHDDLEDPEIILLYTDKKQYTNEDIIKITGLVSTLNDPSVLIGIYDPFGIPTGFILAQLILI